MNENYLNKLEYFEILELLSKYSITYCGKELCLNLRPCFKSSRVSKLLQETSEAVELILRKGSIPLYSIPDIGVYIKNLESSYSLSSRGLLDIAKILKLCRELKEYFYKDENFNLSDFSILDGYFSSLYSNINVEKQILSSIIDEDVISDDASSTLFSIRKSKKNLESEIKENLNNMIHSSSFSKYIMEPIVTIRNDRYVIPVKEEFRGNVKGFIHDISSSGSTVFIEPMAVFELNNKIGNLKVNESIEIQKILAKLSSLLFPIFNELNRNINLIGLLDFIFAKAKYSMALDATMPIINNEKAIRLERARHPLIDKDQVVPINIEIGRSYSSLIITGPNTGGKTVCLKTVGLLTLMALSGLHIPAKENSSIYVFDNIFVDIGDEQSIGESLSTFSAHMFNITYIINNLNSNSLILLDELGSGTDPAEGASLATAILEYLNNCKALTIATTHYQEIKHYALVTDGFENASSEFDIENLRPTYKLLIGVPGKSYAFSISKKIGLSDEILDKAKHFLKEDNINIEELLKNIYDSQVIIEKQKEEITKNLNQAQALRKSLEKEITSKNDKELKNIEKAKLEAKNIIISAKEEANSTIKDIEEIYSNWKSLDELDFENLTDNEIGKFVRNLKNYSIKNANKLRTNLNSSLASTNSISSEKPVSSFSKDMLKVGMKLRVNSFTDIATVCSLAGKSNKVLVQVGSAKVNISLSDINSIISDNVSNTSIITKGSSSSFKSKTATTEINVIGYNVDEACFAIDKYLDDCYLAKLKSVRIVHGKGTGKLREGIHLFLRKHPHVKSFRLGTFGEGEMGVTVVELK